MMWKSRFGALSSARSATSSARMTVGSAVRAVKGATKCLLRLPTCGAASGSAARAPDVRTHVAL
eukprot:4690325-Pyramimonas_sp.AAC.1